MRCGTLLVIGMWMAVIVGISAQGPARSTGTAARYRMGHSTHGKAFDEGPRERPTKMDGIGRAHFPITTAHPDVQAWFDQGYTLLLSFWFYEAERAFRWCLKLEPDNAMAYWGLARATSGDRGRAFFKQALARKDKVTPRERAYLDAYALDGPKDEERERFKRALERLVLDFPADLEAKVTLAEVTLGKDRIGTELLLRQVLAAAPDHPAGHHYRIHNWDGLDGAQAIDSCQRYGTIVPRIGHALHMPGHAGPPGQGRPRRGDQDRRDACRAQADFDKPDHAWMKPEYETQAAEIEGDLALARGDAFKGLARLADMAERELTLRDEYDDPPGYPYVGYVKLGRAYPAAQSPALARAAFDKALAVVPGDPFALAGLVHAQLALGERGKATEAYARVLFTWSDAEPGLAPLDALRRLGLSASPKDTAPGPQRAYRRQSLETHGPAIWTANPAPALDVRDVSGTRVTLADYRGRNVLLVFYLGGTCVHCMKQLKDLAERKDALERLDTVLLAVSTDTPAVNKPAQAGFAFRLLSDPTLETTRRFKSYDDFEEMPIHSTVLIDRQGRIHWARHGGEPFGGTDFILSQLRRMNELHAPGGAANGVTQ